MDKLLFFPSIDQFGQRTSEVLFSEDGFEKTASQIDYAEPVCKFLKTVTPNVDKYLYMLLHALGAGEVWGANINGDYFPEKFLEYDGPEFGHKTFESLAKLYKHHENKDPDRSYGDVLYSHYDKDMHRVLLVVAIDREKAPDICNRIEINGEYPDVSMGCKVPYDICSICGHKAKSPKMYCDHAKYQMNHIYPDGRKVFVINPTPRFFDISQVFIGAEKPAKFLHKIAASEMQSGKSIFTFDHYNTAIDAGIEKQASILSMPSAILAEKVGYSTKEADMIKSVPAGETGAEDNDDKQKLVLRGLGNLRRREGRMSDGVVYRLAAHPIKKVLSTLTSKGIALGPGEFQKIVLIRMGQRKLAHVLDKKNIEFDITDDLLSIEPMDFNISDIDPEIEKGNSFKTSANISAVYDTAYIFEYLESKLTGWGNLEEQLLKASFKLLPKFHGRNPYYDEMFVDYFGTEKRFVRKTIKIEKLTSVEPELFNILEKLREHLFKTLIIHCKNTSKSPYEEYLTQLKILLKTTYGKQKADSLWNETNGEIDQLTSNK